MEFFYIKTRSRNRNKTLTPAPTKNGSVSAGKQKFGKKGVGFSRAAIVRLRLQQKKKLGFGRAMKDQLQLEQKKNWLRSAPHLCCRPTLLYMWIIGFLSPTMSPVSSYSQKFDTIVMFLCSNWRNIEFHHYTCLDLPIKSYKYNYNIVAEMREGLLVKPANCTVYFKIGEIH